MGGKKTMKKKKTLKLTTERLRNLNTELAEKVAGGTCNGQSYLGSCASYLTCPSQAPNC